MISDYRATAYYQSLAPATRRNSDKAFRKLEPLLDRPVKEIGPQDIHPIISRLTPGMAHVVSTRTAALFRFAVEAGQIDAVPMPKIKLPKIGEYRPWTKDEYRLFMARAKPNVKLACLLAYYTCQRMSDVIRMRWDDIQGGRLRIVQQKTGIEVSLKITGRLKKLLDETPRRGETIVQRPEGGAYVLESFRKAFWLERERLRLPKDFHFHGLRKLKACDMAERGATTEMIKAVGGWKTSKQVDHYTKSVRREALADAAMEMDDG